MHIKINSLKSIGTTVDFNLRDVNFFVGLNGSGKSILAGLIQLFKRNDTVRDFRRRQFPPLTYFDAQEDWRNWAHKGNLSKASTVVRSISFLNRKANLMVKIKDSSSVSSGKDKEWMAAQVESFIIQDGQMPLLIWGPEERRINTREMAIYLFKAIQEYGIITAEEWEEEMDIPLKDGSRLCSGMFKKYIAEGPEFYEDNGSQLHFFYLDIQSMFFRRRLSITNNQAFEPIALLMEKVLLYFQEAMLTFLIDSPVLTGKRKLQWEENRMEKKNQLAQDYFGISIDQQKISLEDGTFQGRQLFAEYQGRKEAFEKCSRGIQSVCSWIEEWTDAVHKLNRQSDSLFFSAEKVIFIQNPEKFLHSVWQRKLLRMILDEASNHTHWKIVIETHSQVLIDEIKLGISKNELERSDVALFCFSKDDKFQTSIQQLPLDRYRDGEAIIHDIGSVKRGIIDFGVLGWN
jgi:AAA15 family ATPase/GTPase